MTADIEFADLPNPPRTGTPGKWATVAAALRERPGEWAKVDTCETQAKSGSRAQMIRDGRVKVFRPLGSFEAVSRGVDVWARYVGGAS